ncbi:MAG: HlyD family secretion protein [Lachnospiraceae bacterium]|jgi:hypothetical protein|nr:HlyD family efflux transporter periplasmic adaptor subunit [Lachnospiraceae bacterium]
MSRQIKTLEQLRDSRILYDRKPPAFGYMILLSITLLLVITIIWSIKTPKTYVIRSSGIVESSNKTYIMSPYTGEISEMYISEGTVVEQGDVLFKVKSTDINLQVTQMEEQKKSYEERIAQCEKLVKSIRDNKNYFDITKKEDSLYYSQYEAYKSQVAQNQLDTSTYQAYGYTQEQIESQMLINQAKITEIYFSAIQSAENAILEAQTQIAAIDAQLLALNQGQSEYIITASQSGTVHMISDYDIGMVVQAASAVGSIASEQDEYSIIAYVSAEDAAKTQIGNKADIAVAGLTQSVYGTISGKVVSIDTDITTAQTSDEGEGNSYFKVHIKPDNKYLISKAGNKANLSNGMAVETRIQYDEITYFNYILEALGVLTR